MAEDTIAPPQVMGATPGMSGNQPAMPPAVIPPEHPQAPTFDTHQAQPVMKPQNTNPWVNIAHGTAISGIHNPIARVTARLGAGIMAGLADTGAGQRMQEIQGQQMESQQKLMAAQQEHEQALAQKQQEHEQSLQQQKELHDQTLAMQAQLLATKGEQGEKLQDKKGAQEDKRQDKTIGAQDSQLATKGQQALSLEAQKSADRMAELKLKPSSSGTWSIAEDANGNPVIFNNKTAQVQDSPANRTGTYAKGAGKGDKAITYAENYSKETPTGPGDEALMEQYFDLARPSSGFRMSQPQIDMLMKARSWVDSAEGKAYHAANGTYFAPDQRAQIIQTMRDLGKASKEGTPKPGPRVSAGGGHPTHGGISVEDWLKDPKNASIR